MVDTVYQSFLERQRRAGIQLAEQSDRVSLLPLSQVQLFMMMQLRHSDVVDQLHTPGSPLHQAALQHAGQDPPNCYAARFDCRAVLRGEEGRIEPQETQADVVIRFPTDYVRHARPEEVLMWMGPDNIVHPNVLPPAAICAGRFAPGTDLVDLVYQCYEIITYFNWAAHDPLNEEAAQWARGNQHLFPVDRRPLLRPQKKSTDKEA